MPPPVRPGFGISRPKNSGRAILPLFFLKRISENFKKGLDKQRRICYNKQVGRSFLCYVGM